MHHTADNKAFYTLIFYAHVDKHNLIQMQLNVLIQQLLYIQFNYSNFFLGFHLHISKIVHALHIYSNFYFIKTCH